MIIGFTGQSLYEQIGGDSGVHQLVNGFYDIIEQERHPEVHLIRSILLQGRGIEFARKRQFEFLSGLFGGPQRYVENPDVERMHAHITISPRAKDVWLECMQMAMNEMNMDPRLKLLLMDRFTKVARLLVNQGE